MSNCFLNNLKPTHQKLFRSINNEPIKGTLQGKRKFTKGITGKRIVFFSSYKNKGLMPCESRLESDNCLDLEFNDSVKKYQTQPFTLKLDNNKSYTPDSIHEDENGCLTVREVKFSGALKCEVLVKRLNKIENILTKMGVSFVVLTEKDLKQPPNYSNRKYLYRCSHLNFNKFQLDEATQLLPTKDIGYTLENYRDDCQKHGLESIIADTTLFLNLAAFTKGVKLSPISKVWKAGEIL